MTKPYVRGIVFPSDDRTGEFGHTCPFVQANEKAVDHDLADTGVTTISIFLSDELLIAVRAALRELDPAVGSTD